MRNITNESRYGSFYERFNPKGHWLNTIDPMYYAAYLACYNVLNPKDENGQRTVLPTSDRGIVMQNVSKHRWVFWIATIIGISTYMGLLELGDDKAAIQGLISVLLAPAFVTGSAWFAITFGGIKEDLLVAALGLTMWMFGAFVGSMVMMAVSVSFILPMYITCALIAIIMMVIYAAITYDNVDALKIGLDDALRKNSLTNIALLNDLGYKTRDSATDTERVADKKLLSAALEEFLKSSSTVKSDEK